MAAFIEDLWNSIFTPGPTSTLLIATNVTFGALQIVLLALLVATYSIHFLVLSVLCGGLWAAINWFANELNAAKAQDERERAGDYVSSTGSLGAGGAESAMDTGDDTEIEEEKIVMPKTIPGTPVSGEALQGLQGVGVTKTTGAKTGESQRTGTGDEEQTPTKPVWNTSIAASLWAPEGADARARQRNAMKESSSSVSTDGEWEKVEGES